MRYAADKARLRAVAAPHAGDWLNAPPLTAIGLRLSNEAVRVAVGFRLGCTTCQPRICICGTTVDARGLHELSCWKSGPRHIRHSQLNDLIWRAVKRAQIPATKQPIGLSRSTRRDQMVLLLSLGSVEKLSLGTSLSQTHMPYLTSVKQLEVPELRRTRRRPTKPQNTTPSPPPTTSYQLP